MKFLLIAVLFAALGARCQPATATAKVPDPPYLNNVYYWSADTLLSLEKTSAEMKRQMQIPFLGGRGGGGGAPNYIIEGPRSPLRVKAGAPSRFVVKITGMMDPSSLIKLYRFEAQKKSREVPLSNKKYLIDCNIQKSGADVYIFVPALRLPPGEYGFQHSMMMGMMMPGAGGTQSGQTFFAFGVDQ
jgi:hypothetical protein